MKTTNPSNEMRARLRYLRIAPRKVRLVADMIRGKSVEEAESQLRFLDKKGANPIQKLLRSAVTNAKHNAAKDADRLFIKHIAVDKGPTLKRFRPRSRGMASPIRKRTSHITLVLGESI